MTDLSKWMLAGVLAVGLVVTPRAALASDEFITVLEQKWHIKRLPVAGKGCRLCHTSDSGGRGTATQPFGSTLFKQAGVKGGDTASLAKGVDYVVKNHTNSDRDPVPDYEEIVRDFTNPNDARDFKVPPEPDAGTGEGGAAGVTGAGGDGAVPAPPDYYAPPPAGDLPPPFYHGCTLGQPVRRTPHVSALLVIALAALRRVERARSRRLTARRD